MCACICVVPSQVAEGWSRDYGWEFGKQSTGDVNFGWSCRHESNYGTTVTSRDYGDGYLNWFSPGVDTCTDGGHNEFNIEVPYGGSYLVSYHLTGGCCQEYEGVAFENVRTFGANWLNGHGEDYLDDAPGYTAIMEVDVWDGNLTMSFFAGQAAYFRWIQIEKLASAESTAETTTGAYRWVADVCFRRIFKAPLINNHSFHCTYLPQVVASSLGQFVLRS